jgi:predicted Ser/Thr protein kinase
MIEELENQPTTMRVLYVIFVLCVAALLFTALAAARHIRRHEQKRKSLAEEAAVATAEAAPDSEVLVSAGKTQGH